MMKNKKGTMILSIILAVQFIIPLSVWGYETYKNKELEKKGQQIKFLVNYVDYDEQRIEFQATEIWAELEGYSEEGYLVFREGGDGFYTCDKSKTIPDTDLYVSHDRMYNWYKDGWCFKYESKVTKAQYKYDYYQLYNRANELTNIKKGFCQGTETQAYAILKIYKNRFKVINVYIDGMAVDTVIEKYNNNEWDNSRYEYHYEPVDKYDDFYEYHEQVAEYYGDGTLDDEYVTEPVAA